MGLISGLIKAAFMLIYGMFLYVGMIFQLFTFFVMLIKSALIHIELIIEYIIGYFLPFSTKMKDQNKKGNIILLIFLIMLKLAVTAIAWYFVVVPFRDAYLHGYISFFFYLILTPISVVLVFGLLFNLLFHIQMRIQLENRTISMLSWFFNYWTRVCLKVIYWLFLVTTLFMLYTVNKGNVENEIISVVAKYEYLNVLNLFILSMIYLLINRFAGVKVHQYFYYYFNLHIDIDEYEERLQQLSKHFSILYTEFDEYTSYYAKNAGFYKPKYARKIVLRNKYIPVSFTLNYYTDKKEIEYHAVYDRGDSLFTRIIRSKNTRDVSVFPRTPIIQKNYLEKVRKLLEEGPRKVKFPLGKILIVARTISVILLIALVGLTYKVYTWEAFLAVKSSVFWTIFFLMVLCLITYLFAWFYMNIMITIFMFVLMNIVGFTEVLVLFILLIVLTIIANLITLSFWKQKRFEKLLGTRFTR